jgi:hypothetical protein
MTTTVVEVGIEEQEQEREEMAAEAAPSPEKGYGEQVLDDIEAELSRFAQFPSIAALHATTLWAAHTHAVDQDGRMVFDSTPRLAILSDHPASGKSVVLQVLEELTNRGDWVTDPTAWGVVDAIGVDRETVLIDEIDMFIGAGGAGRKTIETLNSGYRKKAKTVRAAGKKISIFGPVAMAGLGRVFKSAQQLHPLRSRTIMYTMAQRSGVTLDPYRSTDDDPYLNVLRDACHAWVRSVLGEIEASRPGMPEGITDRDAQIWEPLFIIAEQAGGEWPQRAYDACRSLSQGKGENVLTLLPAQRIIGDLKVIFDATGAERLGSQEIVAALFSGPGSTWRDLWVTETGAPMRLANLLKSRYGIGPDKWRDGDDTVRGYYAAQFAEQWATL